MDLFPIVVNQSISFAVLILIGVICVKTGILTEQTLPVVSRVVMKLCLPLLIFTNTINGANRAQLIAALPMLIAVAALFLLLAVVGVLLAKLFRLPCEHGRLLQALTMFGNVGFIGIPIVSALFPERGMLYIALYTIIDQLLLWTVGVQLTSPLQSNGKSVWNSIKSMVNPASVGVVLGVIGILLGVHLPAAIDTPLTKVGACSSPLALIYLGGLFCYCDIPRFVRKAEFYVIGLIKMIALPIGFYCILRLFFADLEMVTALTMLSALPCMSTIAMFSQAHGTDAEYTAGGVMMTTLFSIITLPFVSWVLTNL
ncbi:MAG: AEC family transporter [Butyricicoccus sp.]